MRVCLSKIWPLFFFFSNRWFVLAGLRSRINWSSLYSRVTNLHPGIIEFLDVGQQTTYPFSLLNRFRALRNCEIDVQRRNSDTHNQIRPLDLWKSHLISFPLFQVWIHCRAFLRSNRSFPDVCHRRRHWCALPMRSSGRTSSSRIMNNQFLLLLPQSPLSLCLLFGRLSHHFGITWMSFSLVLSSIRMTTTRLCTLPRHSKATKLTRFCFHSWPDVIGASSLLLRLFFLSDCATSV